MAIRVVQIIDRLNVGGPTKYVTWLSSLLIDEFETCVVTGHIVKGEGDMSWYAKKANVDLRVIPEFSREISIKDFIVLYKMITFLCYYKPQVVHTHKAKAGAIGRLAVYVYRILTGKQCKVIHTYHGHIFHSYYNRYKTKLFVIIERVFAKYFTDVIITISRQQKQEINEIYRIGNKNQHRIIPYGLDFSISDEYVPCLNHILGVSNNVPIVGFVGRLCEIKNLTLFVHAAKLLKSKGIKCKFVLIGDGNLRSDLESLVAELGLKDTVFFMGFRNDVMNIYTNFTLISITSLNEGTPFTLLEAMHFKVPVVSTLVGGVVDIMGEPVQLTDLPPNVSAWENGLTVKSQDTVAFADAVQYIIEHDKLAQTMGRDASKFVGLHYSQQRFLLDMASLYRQLSNSQF